MSAADSLLSDELDRLIGSYRHQQTTGTAVRGSLASYLARQEYDPPTTAALLAMAIERLAT